MKLIDVIAGARPNFVKIAPIISQIIEYNKNNLSIGYRLIHTGQHYDKNMSQNIFDQLQIPEPDINFKTGSGSQAQQVGDIMVKYESVLANKKCNMCLVVGDVNSTMACAITAKKFNIPVAHVEAGIRSFDLKMPEEINRMVTDSISDWFFTTTKIANQNLYNLGINKNRIFFVGNTMIDTLLNNYSKLKKPEVFNRCNLINKQYIVLTLHRPSNVDQNEKFFNIITLISKAAGKYKIIFPVHPRTLNNLKKLNLALDNIILEEPMGYLEFNYLVKDCMAVITDSGGVTEEATVMGIPCLTLRDSTERPETVTVGTNELVGTDPKGIKQALDKLFAGKWKKGAIPEKWDGKTGLRIVAVLEKILCN